MFINASALKPDIGELFRWEANFLSQVFSFVKKKLMDPGGVAPPGVF